MSASKGGGREGLRGSSRRYCRASRQIRSGFQRTTVLLRHVGPSLFLFDDPKLHCCYVYNPESFAGRSRSESVWH